MKSAWSLRKWTNDVDAPLFKRPGTVDGYLVALLLMGDIGVELTFVASLDGLLHVGEQRTPVISPA